MAPNDIIGYVGTTLVIISFLCQSLIRLRIFNATGSLIITIYAVLNHAWPVVLLDSLIFLINIVHVIKNIKSLKNKI